MKSVSVSRASRMSSSSTTYEFYKSRTETTAFDQRHFWGRLKTNNGCQHCQQVLRPKHRGVFQRFSCPFAVVWTMLSREFGWRACRIPCKTSWRISMHFADDVRLSKGIISVPSPLKIALIKSCRLTSWFIKNRILIYANRILIYANSVLNYVSSNLTFQLHVIRTLNSWVVRLKRKYDLVNEEVETDSRKLDWKWFHLIHLLLALIFCQIRRSIDS